MSNANVTMRIYLEGINYHNFQDKKAEIEKKLSTKFSNREFGYYLILESIKKN